MSTSREKGNFLRAELCNMNGEDWRDWPGRLDMIRELLADGMDAEEFHTATEDESSPMFFAVLHGDAEMLNIMLEAGADPNAEQLDDPHEKLYDWAEFDYRYNEWDLSLPEKATQEERTDEDLWVRWLDRLAIQYGKNRPFYLMCLRRHGALSMSELATVRAREIHGGKLRYNVLDAPDDFCRFVAHACAADFAAMRRMVEEGFALSSVCAVPTGAGRTLLQTVIDELGAGDRLRLDIVRECLALGADVRQRNSDNTGALFSAVLNRDAEMLDILLQAGADPNEEKTLASWKTLYDWAVVDYRKEVWKYAEPANPDIPHWDEIAWLAHVDACAIEQGKERPLCALRLRQAGALSIGEKRKEQGEQDD